MFDAQSAEKSCVPRIKAEHHSKLRIGFGLCCAALALGLVGLIALNGADMFSSFSSDTESPKPRGTDVKLVSDVLDFVIEAIQLAGFVCLYLVPCGQRWRQTSTLLLAMAGVDFVIIGLHTAGAQPIVLAVADRVGPMLTWIELWLLAVLAAEAAEAAERPDITYQTEQTGRMIIWGAFAWLASMIWSFDTSQIAEPAAKAAPESIGFVLVAAGYVLLLLVLGRTAFFCAGLASAYAPVRDQPSPGAPA